MPIHQLTKRSVDAIVTTRPHEYIWDSELPGFGLRVTATGIKAYVVQYREAELGRDGKTKRITLGRHGVLTPEEARKLARQALGRVAHGGDPAAERAAKRGLPTVAELGKEYLKYVEAHRKPTTQREYKRLWEKHILPALGSKQVPSVTTSEVEKLHTSLKDTPYTANRVLALVSSFFSFAAKEKVIKSHENPAKDVEAFAEHARERFLTPKEFTRLGQALTRAETTGLPASPEYKKTPKSEVTIKHRAKTTFGKLFPADPYAVAAIRLLALTGCREGEILNLTWDAVDLERGYLRLADTKTGRSVRPLGASAATLLKDLRKVRRNPYVFPGSKEKRPLGDVQRLWYAVRHAAGLPDLRLHDLRHSFASVPAASGESMLVLKSLLGHHNVATTERYAHLGDDPVKRAADKASQDIAGWMRPEASATTSR